MSGPAGLNLRQAPAQYDAQDQQQLRSQLEAADLQNHKRDRHLEMRPGTYFILTDTDGSAARYAVTINGGALTVTAL